MDRSIAGIILAGGQSRRMGGGDKPLLSLGKGRLIEHVAARLKPQVGTLALNANSDPAQFAGMNLPVLADTVLGYAGPLAGILTGLEWAADTAACRSLVSAAGDTPFFPGDLVERLAAAARERPGAIAVASSDGRWHPTFALWPIDLRDALHHFLVDEDNRRVLAFMHRHDFVQVEFPMIEAEGKRIDPFFNINTPDDLAEAQRLLQSLQP
ncbi:MAG: molybdenum cofactor guanylyltransferase MobA [Mesorhizobium sp.]|uniref:molybdenum cofactor guanylyltransferase MobA n=1 Tax=Mesorhizobium sp. TaxID=1871066 RepID=UPI000FE329EA|nr:molybdenum cofactor guanylyltransferase MobA [Mesorhizobium sp.]RWK11811.1 MAG: molybdenum cofactor guanylyltransferase MobA [Mesorhizobium sp.]RWK24993.1 MAG: molybdenum cofactor guanylyltransferase MobA [Mesorhizobium sp.]RWK30709.1 MAG: molybdenum cofactor guanylyltransferase MobA [Mesorhizobium sp.]TIQ49094.1 MAG: molybdenum cofactor guanylyltransferase MobA [Mesorhizobium sp.]TIQ58827.1 MAG: molybdenum cofactor guanylyltransferase MobA [Mesorhizobium sp.]